MRADEVQPCRCALQAHLTWGRGSVLRLSSRCRRRHAGMRYRGPCPRVVHGQAREESPPYETKYMLTLKRTEHVQGQIPSLRW